ncbi:MAG: hypothetical protein NTY48_05190, partial [Candidatus Diapherotrites archaeon]|nr:hypothetical protein [Candidatus Diapherotrites archaeon]
MKNFYWVIILILVIGFSTSAFSVSPIFYESFDSNQSVRDNNGYFTTMSGSSVNIMPTFSVIEQGFVGNAVHLKGGEFVQYPLKYSSKLNQGTMEFLFKMNSFLNRQGLIELDGNYHTLFPQSGAYGSPYNMGFVLTDGSLFSELRGGGQASIGAAYPDLWQHIAL